MKVKKKKKTSKITHVRIRTTHAIKITIYRNFEPRNTGNDNEGRQEKDIAICGESCIA